VRLVLGSYYLDAPGGAVTYFATAAEHLQKLGHEVHAFARSPGTVAEWLGDRGVVVAGPDELPGECDAVLVQDAMCAYELAERYPQTPQAFVAHGSEFDIELSPQVPGVIGAVVVMNDRMRRRVEASALDVEVVRLRQPIDYNRFVPHGDLPKRPRRAVLLGNYLKGDRREAVTSALEQAGVEWSQLGRPGEVTADPSVELGRADLVLGYGRSVLEGMAAGCAAYVCEFAVDGWVTAERYAAMEADGFAGTAFDESADPARLAQDLDRYDSGMGVVNRELAAAHHSAHVHATELATLLARLAPRHTPPGERSETARLVRLQWEATMRALNFQGALIRAERRVAEVEERAVGAERRALEAEGRLEEVQRSGRYRLAQALAATAGRLRLRRR
jgi:hypothetical protein